MRIVAVVAMAFLVAEGISRTGKFQSIKVTGKSEALAVHEIIGLDAD